MFCSQRDGSHVQSHRITVQGGMTIKAGIVEKYFSGEMGDEIYIFTRLLILFS
jgi:hypothetical protein